MNKRLLKYVVFCLFLAQFHFVLAGVLIANPGLSVSSEGSYVKLVWQTTSQDNLDHFVVQRKMVSGGFIDLAEVRLESDMTYEYLDKTAYKTESTVYTYRLLIVHNDGTPSATSSEEFVYHDNEVSSVRRTWGSIKAIFR